MTLPGESSVIVPPGVTPTGERVERVIEGVGTVTFENYLPGTWLTKRGAPAKTSRRRYLLDGEEIDSVSSIVGTLDKPALQRWIEDQATRGAALAERMGELAGVPEQDWCQRVKSLGLGASAKRDEGADRGTVIHKAMDDLTRGVVPNPSEFPALARPWVQGAMRAWIAMDPKVIASEQIVAHPVLRYAGRPDLVALIDGRTTLVDWKTGKGRAYPESHWQTRLYEMALERCGVYVERIIVIAIGDDGSFELTECATTESEALALVAVYRARKRIAADMAAQRRIAKAAA